MGIEEDIKRIMERQDEMNIILNNIVNAIITDRKKDRQDKEKRIKETLRDEDGYPITKPQTDCNIT